MDIETLARAIFDECGCQENRCAWDAPVCDCRANYRTAAAQAVSGLKRLGLWADHDSAQPHPLYLQKQHDESLAYALRVLKTKRKAVEDAIAAVEALKPIKPY